MAQAFVEGRRVLNNGGIGSVVFAHKTTEGWEALLSGMIRGGWTIAASWPIATEQPNRMRSHGSAALATSVHLVCRPRPVDAPVGDWADVLRELPVRVGDWMARLQAEDVRGADLVFACVGPALEVFSRYTRVETAAGDVVGLPEYLEKVWEVVGRAALEQVLGTPEAQARNGTAGVLEEDARLTALFLWTVQSAADGTTDDSGDHAADAANDDADDDNGAAASSGKGYRLPYDVTRRFAQPLGIHLDEWKSRIIGIDKGVVRLLPVTERSAQLFGPAGASELADEFETAAAATPQLTLFPEPTPTQGQTRPNATPAGQRRQPARQHHQHHQPTQQPNHPSGCHHPGPGTRRNAVPTLRTQPSATGYHRIRAGKRPHFLRLANALSASTPRGSQEKRLLDAMLLAVPPLTRPTLPPERNHARQPKTAATHHRPPGSVRRQTDYPRYANIRRTYPEPAQPGSHPGRTAGRLSELEPEDIRACIACRHVRVSHPPTN